MIYIGREDKVVFFLNEPEQVAVNRLWCIQIAIDIDIPAPIGPVFFQTVKGIEPAGIHIAETILGDKIPKILLKAFAGIDKPSGSGKPGSCADHHCVRRMQFLFQTGYFIGIGVGRFHNRCP